MAVDSGDVVGGRYTLLDQIGQGGMGEVWRAQDSTLERPIALKILSGQAATNITVDAFLHEARMSAAVRHRNVVEVMDFGTHDDGAPYMVMELLVGESLGDIFYREGQLSFGEIVTTVTGTLSGLAAAHDAGIVHRDLKPENIFLVTERDAAYAKILDFGISKSLEKEKPSSLVTQEGRVVGTPAYMSPEQARGLRDIDHRTDLYSIGVILYEALAGEPPFFSQNPGDLMVKIITEPTPRLVDTMPGVGEELSNFIEKSMNRVPELRYQSADEMRRDLEFLSTKLLGSNFANSLSNRPRPPSWRQSQNNTASNVKPVEVSGRQLDSTQAPPAEKRGKLWIGLGAGAAAIILIGLGMFLARSDAPSPDSPYVIKVQSPGAASAAGAAAGLAAPNGDDAENPAAMGEPVAAEAAAPEAEADAPASAQATAPSPRTTAKRRTRKPKSASADDLSTRFQKQKRGVVKCLQNAGADATEGTMSIRFSIDASGRVTKATVLPAALSATPTGACMQRAAKAMRFGPQTAPVTFRIPLRAKAGG